MPARTNPRLACAPCASPPTCRRSHAPVASGGSGTRAASSSSRASPCVFILFLSARGIAGFWTDYLWYDALGFGGVFRNLLVSRIALAGDLHAALRDAAVRQPLGRRSLGATGPPAPGPEEQFLERYQDMLRGRRVWFARIGVSLLFGLIAGVPVAAQWRDWILFTNSVSFGAKDPLFGVDIGFYVFRLPFLSFVIDWLFASMVIILIVTAVAHYLNGGIRLQVQGQRVTPQVKAHLSVLLALLAILRAVGYWLQRYSLLTSDRGFVDGATYTAVKAELPAINLLFLISILAAVLLVVNIWQRGWRLPIIAVGLWGLVAVVAGTIYPAFVQRFVVQPAESEREKPYITRNIEATRAALGLDNVQTEPYKVDTLDVDRATGQRRQPAQRAPARSRGRPRHLQAPAGPAGLLPVQRPRRRPLRDQRQGAAGRPGRPRAEPERPPDRHVGGPAPRLHPRLRHRHGARRARSSATASRRSCP